MMRFLLAATLLFFICNTCSANPFASAEANLGQWNWIPLPGMRCRDQSHTGIGVRLLPDTTAVLIYLQGGGACYDEKSCTDNARASIAGANYSGRKFAGWARMLGNQGIFNTTNADNPVARWNHVFIPYCTGDLHGGARPRATVDGVPKKQQFVGYKNVASALAQIAPYFRDAEDIGLVGASAGGFGVLLNYPQVVRAFNGRSVAALVDSAPIIPDSSIKTECFQRKVIDTFNLQIPPSCRDCRDPKTGGLLNLFNHLASTYPQGRFALASADADLAGIVLYNQESRACGGGGVNIFNYRFSLYALRDNYIGREWATFLPGGLQHTMTQSDELFLQRKFKGFSAGQWLGRINDEAPLHIPPAELKSTTTR